MLPASNTFLETNDLGSCAIDALDLPEDAPEVDSNDLGVLDLLFVAEQGLRLLLLGHQGWGLV